MPLGGKPMSEAVFGAGGLFMANEVRMVIEKRFRATNIRPANYGLPIVNPKANI